MPKQKPDLGLSTTVATSIKAEGRCSCCQSNRKLVARVQTRYESGNKQTSLLCLQCAKGKAPEHLSLMNVLIQSSRKRKPAAPVATFMAIRRSVQRGAVA